MQVAHHDNIGKVIGEYEKAGWRLHTYACTGNATEELGTNHYLLFEMEVRLGDKGTPV